MDGGLISKVAMDMTIFQIRILLLSSSKNNNLLGLMITHCLKDNQMQPFSVIIFGVVVLGWYHRNVRPINASPAAREAPSR